MSGVDASIVLVTKNGAAFLDDVLRRVRLQAGAERMEIVAIDSGSTDATLAILAHYGVRLVRVPAATFSHSGTRQLALDVAHPSAKHIVYLSQDASPFDEGWLRGLLAPLATDTDVAGVCSRITPRPGCSPLLARLVLADPLGSGTPRTVGLDARERERYWSLSPFEKRVLIPFHNVSSCIRRDVLERVPFPNVPFAEDLAWAHAAALRGYRVAYNPASRVVHSHPYTPASILRRAVLDARANWHLFGRSNLASFSDVPEYVRRGVADDLRYLNDLSLRRAARLRWAAAGTMLHAAAGLGYWRGARQGRARWPAPLFAERDSIELRVAA